MTNLLSIITFLPLVAAAILALFLKGDDPAAQRNAKTVALFATTATFLISLFVLAGFDPADAHLFRSDGTALGRPVDLARLAALA